MTWKKQSPYLCSGLFSLCSNTVLTNYLSAFTLSYKNNHQKKGGVFMTALTATLSPQVTMNIYFMLSYGVVLALIALFVHKRKGAVQTIIQWLYRYFLLSTAFNAIMGFIMVDTFYVKISILSAFSMTVVNIGGFFFKRFFFYLDIKAWQVFREAKGHLPKNLIKKVDVEWDGKAKGLIAHIHLDSQLSEDVSDEQYDLFFESLIKEKQIVEKIEYYIS